MTDQSEPTLSFHGICHYLGRLSKAAKTGMKAALRGCPKCHFPMLEGIIHTINVHGQDGSISVSDLAGELHQTLPAISRALRLMETDGLLIRETAPDDRRKTLVRITPAGYAACGQCEDALSDYFSCIIARLEPEQVAQLNALRGALMDAVVAENAARQTKPEGEPNHDKDL